MPRLTVGGQTQTGETMRNRGEPGPGGRDGRKFARVRCALAGVVLAVFVVLAVAPVAQAEENTVLRVSFNDLPPWKMLGPGGKPSGKDIEFIDMLAARLGLTVEYVHYPFKRGLKMMESGEIDLMSSVLRTPEREAYMHFLDPPYKSGACIAFFVLKESEHTIASHEDLVGLRVGTTLGSLYYPQFDKDTRIAKYPVNSADLNIKMLLADRIDVFAVSESAGDYRVAALGLEGVVVKAPHAYRMTQGVHMALSRHSPHAARLEEFNRAMAELVAEGALGRAKERLLRKVAGP
jgi:polar amino acid transport system substrate-binding protein